MLDDADFLDELVAAGILLPSGVDGVLGRSFLFEDVVERLDAMITREGADQDAEVIRLPPVLPRTTLEASGYLNGFPHLVGMVHCFCGDDRGHAAMLNRLGTGGDWTAGQTASDLALTPAACYPVYPLIARRGTLADRGHTVDVASYCFRREPSRDPTRLQMFRQREYVRFGTPDQVMSFRDAWMERGRTMTASLGLPLAVDLAHDPFFGRLGKLLAQNQREHRLKYELLVPINPGAPTACLSFNYHQDHFAEIWNLRTADGGLAHTACVGFGLERLALALLRHHGFDPSLWPADTRAALGMPPPRSKSAGATTPYRFEPALPIDRNSSV